MAVPKRKWSKRRTHSSHSNWKLKPLALVECPQCHALKLPHVVCKKCGYYKGVQVIDTSAKEA